MFLRLWQKGKLLIKGIKMRTPTNEFEAEAMIAELEFQNGCPDLAQEQIDANNVEIANIQEQWQ